MCFMTTKIGASYIHGKPPQCSQGMMRDQIMSKQWWFNKSIMSYKDNFETMVTQQEHHVLQGLNLGGEDNNHSSQPPKLHPMEIYNFIRVI